VAFVEVQRGKTLGCTRNRKGFTQLTAKIVRANLSRIVSLLVDRLHSSQSHTVLMGCYHALKVLSDSANLTTFKRFCFCL
jgi:hypothetical protein